jgi:hypothetical protein
MTVQETYDLILYATAKNNSQGYVSPEDFFNTINQAQKSYVSYLLGSFQSYTPGRPFARVELGQNMVVRTRLTPIIKFTNLTLSTNNYPFQNTGEAIYPSDYLQVDAMLTTDAQRIRAVQQDYFYSFYNSTIDPVASNPIYMLGENSFYIYPPSLGSVKLSYVSNPPDIVWAYVLDGNGIPEYTTGIQGVNVIAGGTGYTTASVTFSAPPAGGIQATANVILTSGVITEIQMVNYGSGYANTTPTITLTGDGTGGVLSSPIVSFDPVWDNASMLEIIIRSLSLIGVNLQLNTVEQYSAIIKNQGQ